MKIWVLLFVLLGSVTHATECDISPLLKRILGEDSSVSFETLPQANFYPLPPTFKKLMAPHSIMNLRKQFGSGQSLEFAIEHYSGLTNDLKKLNYGEEIQANFVVKVLKEIFPEARFAPGARFYEKDSERMVRKWATENPGKKRIYLEVIDQAEHPNDALSSYPLNMPILKPANPGIGGLEHGALRKRLKIGTDEKVMSVYSSFPHGLDTSEEIPSIADLLLSIEKKDAPDVVFASAGGNLIKSDAALKIDLAGHYQVHYLSEYEKVVRKKGKHYLFLNNLRGQLPALYNVSDVAVIAGPINLFEPLTVGTKTIFFDNSRVIAGYDRGTFKKMSGQAELTGGAYRIKSLSEFSSKLKNVSELKPTITPPYAVKDKSGQSILNHFLSHLETAILNAL